MRLTESEQLESSRRKYNALRTITDGSVFWVLCDTPSQFEDIMVILVDDKVVVSFELPRKPDGAKPLEIEFLSLDENRDGIGEWGRAEFAFALDFAREALQKFAE